MASKSAPVLSPSASKSKAEAPLGGSAKGGPKPGSSTPGTPVNATPVTTADRHAGAAPVAGAPVMAAPRASGTLIADAGNARSGLAGGSRPVEVKASARPRLSDAVHLRSFRAEYGKDARAALLLHTGSTVEWLAPDVLAAPWWRVL